MFSLIWRQVCDSVRRWGSLSERLHFMLEKVWGIIGKSRGAAEEIARWLGISGICFAAWNWNPCVDKFCEFAFCFTSPKTTVWTLQVHFKLQGIYPWNSSWNSYWKVEGSRFLKTSEDYCLCLWLCWFTSVLSQEGGDTVLFSFMWL